MALGLGREGLHQPDDDEAADDRRQDDERPPRARRIELVGVVEDAELAEEEEVVDGPDHVAEDHGAERGDDADDQGKDDEDGERKGAILSGKFRGRGCRRGCGGVGHGLGGLAGRRKVAPWCTLRRAGSRVWGGLD